MRKSNVFISSFQESYQLYVLPTMPDAPVIKYGLRHYLLYNFYSLF